ncbi:DinB family protein [Roseateles oligotrophus]|uniref:DinB family protein n=1 Tax=Roseateles oligotrophus TaxID=1769250 RepID=A0ABT2YF45_9BURK|nr:DinB family protein [Roseateles oligotrophus]MCV2368673.1 DinB family protein [Roseateles oligotrophus]
MNSARPDPLARHLLSMAYNNGWANQRLLSACAQLSQAEFEARRCSFFPSIKATLNHTLCVDWFYLDALERAQQDLTPHPDCYSFFAADEPFQSCADLQREQLSVDLRLIALCAAQRDDQLERIVTIARPGRPQLETRTRLLAHLFQHQIHHRGQVHAMLAGSSVAPPPLDEFFCAGEADKRAAEFAALGWTEDLIWT